MRGNREGGFTLIEVMVAFGVLAFGLLALAAMQLHSLRQGAVGRRASTAMTVAQDQLESFQALSFGHADLTNGVAWKGPNTVIRTYEGAEAGADEQYTIEWRVTDEVASWMKRIEVQVTWDEPDWPGRQLVLTGRRFNW